MLERAARSRGDAHAEQSLRVFVFVVGNATAVDIVVAVTACRVGSRILRRLPLFLSRSRGGSRPRPRLRLGDGVVERFLARRVRHADGERLVVHELLRRANGVRRAHRDARLHELREPTHVPRRGVHARARSELLRVVQQMKRVERRDPPDRGSRVGREVRHRRREEHLRVLALQELHQARVVHERERSALPVRLERVEAQVPAARPHVIVD
mmetsp:Transcript_7015/g.28911  ORF Transcript_7015/g.28911 Transcript_7015/m.28911 type:complete len:212 (-) Transcript_7015:166-801(-)